jgi:peptidoglycan/xylan/chitin deacetylase (PgdA/CDA1 family)
MKKIIIIFLIIAIIAATGYLFWQKNKLKQISINNNQPAEKQSSELQNNAALQEVSTSTPYIVSDKEISRGNPDKKQVIFTFDCGSGINSADKILEAAQKYNLKLTFFATGKFA